MMRYALTCILVHGAVASAAGPMDRLFYTPQQRAHLDALRTQRALRPPAAAPQARDAVPPAPVVTFSGLVRRSDGRSTVWINNDAIHDRGTPDQHALRARVEHDGAARITLPQQAASVRLKVGQSADLATGRIDESYARTPHARVPAEPSTEPTMRLRRRGDAERDLPVPSPDGP